MTDRKPDFINRQWAAIAASYGLTPPADLFDQDAYNALIEQLLPFLNTSNFLRSRFVAENTALVPEDSEILFDTTGGDRILTLPNSSTLPAGSRAYIVADVAGANNVIIRTTGENFTNGINEIVIFPTFDLRIIGTGGPGAGWSLGGENRNSLQVRRAAAWAAGNFAAFTPVPFDTRDFHTNQLVIGDDIGGASPGNITFGVQGLFSVSAWFTINSTGGVGIWTVDARLQLDGAPIPGAATSALSVANEDGAASFGPVLVQANAGQVLTLELDHTNLTGNLASATLAIDSRIN